MPKSIGLVCSLCYYLIHEKNKNSNGEHMDIVLNSNDSHNSSLTQTKAPRKLFSARDGQSVCSMELIFNELKLPQLLKSCGFRKLCGVSVPVLFKIMLLSVFARARTINGFFSSHLGGTLGFHRDVIYRFAKSPYHNSVLSA